jgi:diguanylate cyclase (GGDEF)-like protein
MTDQSETFTLDQVRRELADEPTAEMPPPTVIARPILGAGLVLIHPRGPFQGRRFSVRQNSVVIGRDPDCPVCIPDDTVSRRHARIDLQPDGYHVTDLGSRNGTAVNDAPAGTAPLRDGDRVRVGWCVFRFVVAGSPEAEYHEELYRNAARDPLTGVPNRRTLEDYLAREVALADRAGRPLSLLLLDIDDFKEINDRFGHPAGDETLRRAAGVMQEAIRWNDLLARYGGDEFAIVLPDTPVDLAFLCGDRIRMAVAGHRFECDDRRFPVTVSVGVGRWGPGVTAADLIARADGRLYDAKRAGRNRVRM